MRYDQPRFGPFSASAESPTPTLPEPSCKHSGESDRADVGDDGQERALDEGLDYFQAQGAADRAKLEGRG